MIATDFISAALIHALGWTLLHAPWQGALLALCVWAYMTRHTGAIGRYRTAQPMVHCLFSYQFPP